MTNVFLQNKRGSFRILSSYEAITFKADSYLEQYA